MKRTNNQSFLAEYESPATEILSLHSEMIICVSGNGSAGTLDEDEAEEMD